MTGIVVNQKLNVSREQLKNFRAVLYQIEKDGLEGHKWGQSEDIIASIQGFANFVSMVNPEKGAKFKEQIDGIKEKYGRKKKAKVPNVSPPILNQAGIVAQINTKLKELGCNKTNTHMYLKKIYNKHSLKKLTEEELLELLGDLTSSQSGDSDLGNINFVKRFRALISQQNRYIPPHGENINEF